MRVRRHTHPHVQVRNTQLHVRPCTYSSAHKHTHVCTHVRQNVLLLLQAPDSIRAQFGTNKTYNACHGSDAPDTAAQELAFFFSKAPGSSAVGRCDLVGMGQMRLGWHGADATW